MYVKEMIMNDNKQMSIFYSTATRSIFTWTQIINNKTINVVWIKIYDRNFYEINFNKSKVLCCDFLIHARKILGS